MGKLSICERQLGWAGGVGGGVGGETYVVVFLLKTALVLTAQYINL